MLIVDPVGNPGTNSTVVGTSNIYERNDTTSENGAVVSGLKYDHTTAEPTILVPQPSDDPNDPLVRGNISNETPERHIEDRGL